MSKRFKDGLTTGTNAVLFREKRWTKSSPEIEGIEVEIKPRTLRRLREDSYEVLMREDVGKTVFLTWEEAHAGLLAKREREVDHAARCLDTAKANLNKARAMRPPSAEAAQ